jgi:hypothetical protein
LISPKLLYLLIFLLSVQALANFYIPLVNDDIQQTIAEKIKVSFKLKAESKKLLDLAKQAVEMAIEQNEVVALEYIDTQTKGLI